MNFNKNIPGLKDVTIHEMTAQENRIVLHISLPREPIDILPNRKKETIKHYLQENGADVEIVVGGINNTSKVL